MSYSDIPGYSDFLSLYDDAIAHFGDGAVFVEVGVALGHSIAYLAQKVIDAGHKNTRIYAVDPWAGTERNGEQQEMLRGRANGDFHLFCKMMLEHAPAELDRITVLRLTSFQASASLRYLGIIPDVVLLDGDHNADAVALDCDNWGPLTMRAGNGWICGDDYRDIYPTVAEGVHRVFPKERVEVCGQNGWSWRVRL